MQIKKHNIFITQKTNGTPVLWKQVSLCEVVYQLFSLCLVIQPANDGSIKATIMSHRPTINHFYNNGKWTLQFNNSLVVSFPVTFISVRQHLGSFFEQPFAYNLAHSPGCPLTEGQFLVCFSFGFERADGIQTGVELFTPSSTINKFVTWSECEQDEQGFRPTGYLGTRLSLNSYSKRFYVSGEVFSPSETLSFECDTNKQISSVVVQTKDFLNMGNVLPYSVYELSNSSSIFFDVILRGMWEWCSLVTIQKIDRFLTNCVDILLPLLLERDGVDPSRYPPVRYRLLHRHLIDDLLSVNFEILVIIGFLDRVTYFHLQQRLIEVGIHLPSLRGRGGFVWHVKITTEIAAVEKLLRNFRQDLKPELTYVLSAKGGDRLPLYHDRKDIENRVARLVCSHVFFSWQKSIGSGRFR